MERTKTGTEEDSGKDRIENRVKKEIGTKSEKGREKEAKNKSRNELAE